MWLRRNFYVFLIVTVVGLGGLSQPTPGAARVDLVSMSRGALGAEPVAPFAVVGYSSPNTTQLGSIVGVVRMDDLNRATGRLRPPFDALVGRPLAAATLPGRALVTVTALATTKATAALCAVVERQRSTYDLAASAVSCVRGRSELRLPVLALGAPVEAEAGTLLWSAIVSIKPDRIRVESPDLQLVPFDRLFGKWVDKTSPPIAPAGGQFLEGWERAPAPVVAGVVASGAGSSSVVVVYTDSATAGRAATIVSRAMREASSPVARSPLREMYGPMTVSVVGRVAIYRFPELPFERIRVRGRFVARTGRSRPDRGCRSPSSQRLRVREPRAISSRTRRSRPYGLTAVQRRQELDRQPFVGPVKWSARRW